MDSIYHKIVKVAWDEMWHGYFLSRSGRVCYDRITSSKAIKLSQNLVNKVVMFKGLRTPLDELAVNDHVD